MVGVIEDQRLRQPSPEDFVEIQVGIVEDRIVIALGRILRRRDDDIAIKSLLRGVGEKLPPDDIVWFPRFGGHYLKGGYDVQHADQNSRATGTAAIYF